MTSYWVLDYKRSRYIENNERSWCMPGIACRACGSKWTTIGAALPSISLEGRAAELTRTPRGVFIEEWRDIARELRPHIPASEPILPGLGFGPLSGRILEPFRLGWYNGCGLIAEEAIREELQALAPEIPLVLSNLKDEQDGRYYELEIRCGGEGFETVKERCDVCGYVVVDFPKGPYALSKVPEHALFRTPFGPAQIFAHERLLPFLKRELGPAIEFIPATLAA